MPRVTAPADDLPPHIGRYQVLKRLGVQGTARNLNTVQQLIELAEA